MGGAVPSGCLHIMLEARSLDDVGRTLDRCTRNGWLRSWIWLRWHATRLEHLGADL